MKSFKTTLAAIVLASAFVAAPAVPAFAADTLRESGRALHEKSAGAVVSLKIVLTTSYAFGGQSSNDQESRDEELATVISPEGLTVTALSSVDPANMMMRRYASRMGPGDKFETKVKDLKIITADNQEIPAMVVLRDPDLDLAFIRPIEKPKAPMAFVDLSKSVAPKMLDGAITLGRMGELAKRTASAMTGEIQGIVEKPRTFYIPSAELASAGLGTPVFLADGSPIGLVMLRMNPSTDEDAPGPSAMPIVIPGADIMDIAKQAPEKAPEPPPAEAAPATDAAAAEPAAGDAPAATE